MQYTSFINKLHISNNVAILMKKHANQSQLLTTSVTHRTKRTLNGHRRTHKQTHTPHTHEHTHTHTHTHTLRIQHSIGC